MVLVVVVVLWFLWSHSLRLVRVVRVEARVVADILRIRLLGHSTTACGLDKSEADSLLLDLGLGEERKFLGGLDVGDLLDVTLGENDVDFLERAVCGLNMLDEILTDRHWQLTSG
jgi:hypothetical protein